MSLILLLLPVALAHQHTTTEIIHGAVISDKEIDRTLWTHILIMLFSFGVLFPIGMVLGLTKSRWHVPIQVTATGLAVLGVVLAHTPRSGRQFESNVHAKFAPFIVIYLIAQVVLGVYLRLHLSQGINKIVRKYAVSAHGWMGTLFPIFSYVQMGFGGITALGFCRNSTGDHLGQCLAHGIMGSAFIGYGIVMCVMLHAQSWLSRMNVSQELLDSSAIMAWGLVNSLTEHRWGHEWSMGDKQHTAMGVLWFCAGIAGVFLSRDRNGKPRRHVVPAAVILLTGWAMSGHAQHLMLSTKMHATFGYTLMAAGITRIAEVAVILRDRAFDPEMRPRAFQYIPPFLLVSSGLLFMGSNEEQIVMVNDSMTDSMSYSLILFSLAFLVFFFANYLILLFQTTGQNAEDFKTGHDGHSYERADTRLVPDDFELGALSDDDDESEPKVAQADHT